MGVSLTKEFIKSPANTISLDVSNYKIVKPFQFACNLMHVGRDKKVAVGMLTDADNVIISPAFTVFETINNNVILPEVLVSWFSQSFFDNEVSYLASEGIRDGIKWHDGEPFTADDVKFTIEAIMDPDNGSENAPNYEDVQEITVTDDQTIAFKLAEPNVAFLEYMTMAILPKHLLDGEDMQESDFFRHPIL